VPQTFSASDGQLLGYEELGSGPRLLCLPGGPGRAAAYLETLGGLDASHTLVLADVRGSGSSRPTEPDTLTIQRLVDDVEDLRVHLGEEHPVLVAHSFGCRIAADYAVQHPGVARALVLVTPPTSGEADAVTAGREAILQERSEDPVYADAIEAARALPTARPRDRAMLEQMTWQLWAGRWDERARAFSALAAEQTPARTSLTLRNAAMSTPPPQYELLTLPVLFVAGHWDYASPPAAVHGVHERLPNSTYVEIEDAGHYPWLDEPDALRGVIEDFVDGVLDVAESDA
jgi:pimeloyl-ACP methyl ester carboxylesterase